MYGTLKLFILVMDIEVNAEFQFQQCFPFKHRKN